MRILLIMDPGISVPPLNYGGHERLVFMFAEEYRKLGHEVSLLAGPNSKISGSIHHFGLNDLKRSKLQKFRELIYAWKFLYSMRNNFDLIHNFGRLAYLLPILNNSAKKIMTYGRPVNQTGIKWINNVPNQQLVFTACSNYCVSTGNVAGNWKTIYNAVDFSKYLLNEVVPQDAPLMFLGRMDKIKGLHTAIEVAMETGNRLWIGGNIPDTKNNYSYFKEVLEPKFDNKQIIYLGALNDKQKNDYLRQSKALLFPIEWNEPFGIVMVEAMACGTPVIAFNKGSAPEIIENGVVGFRVDNKSEMINAIDSISKIDRSNCRHIAFKRYDVSVIAQKYLNLF
jgi:glycosyltransferase involved in cell wall biosynthesis